MSGAQRTSNFFPPCFPAATDAMWAKLRLASSLHSKVQGIAVLEIALAVKPGSYICPNNRRAMLIYPLYSASLPLSRTTTLLLFIHLLFIRASHDSRSLGLLLVTLFHTFLRPTFLAPAQQVAIPPRIYHPISTSSRNVFCGQPSCPFDAERRPVSCTSTCHAASPFKPSISLP